MPNAYIERQKSRTNRNLLLTGIVLTVASAAALGANHNYWRNFLYGPFPMNAAALSSLRDPLRAKDEFIAVSGGEKFHTGITQVVETIDQRSRTVRSSRVTGGYYFVEVGDRLLVTLIEEGHTGSEYSGKIERIPSKVHGRMSDLKASAPEVYARILPFALDASESYRRGGWVLLSLLASMLLIGLCCSSVAILRIQNVVTHPITGALGAFGDPETIAEEIDRELGRASVAYVHKTMVTDSWLLHPLTQSLRLFRLRDAVWVHGHISRSFVNRIRNGKEFSVRIYDAHGKRHKFVCKREEHVGSLLAAVEKRIPWALVGHTASIEEAWKHDRERVTSLVAERRKAFDAGRALD